MIDDLKPVNGWNEWAHRVLGDIEKCERKIGEIFNAIDDVKKQSAKDLQAIAVEIAILKTKASFAGGVWGAIVSIVVSVIAAIIVINMKRGG